MSVEALLTRLERRGGTSGTSGVPQTFRLQTLPQQACTSGTSGTARMDEVREAFEERAAIMEFDGGLSRENAEREAWERVVKRFGLSAGYRLH